MSTIYKLSKRKQQTKRFKQRIPKNKINFDSNPDIFINEIDQIQYKIQRQNAISNTLSKNNFFKPNQYNSNTNKISQILQNLHLGALKNLSDQEYFKQHKVDGIISIIGKRNEQIVKDNKPNFINDQDHLIILCNDSGDQDIIKHFDKVIKFINDHNSTFVHCQAGVSRSVSLCMAYLLSNEQCGVETAEEALKFIKEFRGIAGPNLGFMWQVDQFNKNTLMIRRSERYRCSEYVSVGSVIAVSGRDSVVSFG